MTVYSEMSGPDETPELISITNKIVLASFKSQTRLITPYLFKA